YKKIGKLGAWIAENYPPEDFHIRTIALNRTTLLSFKDERTIILKSPSNNYEITVIDKNLLSKKRKERLEKNGFFKGYDIKRNVVIGNFYLFRRLPLF
ncbi:unnamed protein product, partial [marine sediment metagenome]